MSNIDLEINKSILEQELQNRELFKLRKQLFVKLFKHNKDVELYVSKDDQKFNKSPEVLFKYKDKVHTIDLRELVCNLDKDYEKVSQ